MQSPHSAPPLVSVVVPCFNYGRYVRECVESLARQSYPAWECIIVDDASSDDTSTVASGLAQSDDRVRLLRLPGNRGLSGARNAGIRQARGTYVQLLDADDILEPRKLESQVGFLQDHPDTDVVVGPSAFFEASDRHAITPWQPQTRQHLSARPEPDTVLHALVVHNLCMVHAALVRREVFQRVGSFDEAFRSHEDWEFWLRCALRGCRFGFFESSADRALARRHAANMSKGYEGMLRSAMTLRQRIHSQLPTALAHENRERLLELQWRIGIERVVAGEMREGWRLYAGALAACQRRARPLLRLPLLVPGVASIVRKGRMVVQRRPDGAAF